MIGKPGPGKYAMETKDNKEAMNAFVEKRPT